MSERDFQWTFATAKLADAFRSELLIAARECNGFDPSGGLPKSLTKDRHGPTWYEHTMDFVEVKWPHAAPRHRKGIAEALATVTFALTTPTDDAPSADDVRRALFRWSFNVGARQTEVPDEFWEALTWVERQSLPLTEVERAVNSTSARPSMPSHRVLQGAVER